MRLITGAGRGIGAETAEGTLQAGHSIVAPGRNLEKLPEVYGAIAGNRISSVRVEIAGETQVRTAIETAFLSNSMDGSVWRSLQEGGRF